MAESCKGKWSKSQLRKYTFSTEPIPRLSCSDDKAKKLISDGVYFWFIYADYVSYLLKFRFVAYVMVSFITYST